MRTLAFALLSLASCTSLAAETWPARPLRMVVPFAAGAGSNDIMARLVAQRLTDSLGQTVVVDNRPGASGIIGTDVVAKAPADGYTLLVMSLTLAVNPSLYRKLPYDTLRDLQPVTLIASAPLMLVVHPSVPATSLRELVSYAKLNPGKLNFGSGGPGTTPHLAGEMIKIMAGVSMVHVPYKGGAPALADLVGGQISLMLENIPGTLPFVKGGKLRVLAVTDRRRSPLLPDVPTLDEAGLKGYEIVGWNGLFVPSGTPKARVDRLHAETVRLLALPDMKDRLAVMGAGAVGNTPAEFGTFLREEIAKWARVVKEAGLKSE